MEYDPVIGLEVHIGLKTASKMFCSCSNDPDAEEPNMNICPICAGHPGTLPVLNKEAVLKALKTGLALGCKIPEYSKFDRKNYFYPDLPKGYQISQYDDPICLGGGLEIGKRYIKITRIHLEEDAGKLIHPKGENYSLVDLNRAGVPLIELVTEPDIRSAKEAKAFVAELRLLLRYLGVSDADMEKGELRVDANVSLSLSGSEKLGTKTEIKNINSFRSIERAINYEIERQSDVLKKGDRIVQETRGWDEERGVTISQRSKEASHDYRYFPEPDLPPIYAEGDFEAEKIRSAIPELPVEKRRRFAKEYDLSEKEINFLVFEKDLGDYYEKVVSELKNWIKEIDIKNLVESEEHSGLSRLAANYLLTDLQGILKGMSVKDEKFLITPENFAEFVSLIYKEKISSRIAKIVLKEMFETGGDPSAIIKEKDLAELKDESEIEMIIEEVISQNRKAVNDFKDGKEQSFQFLVGQIMQKTKGKANPSILDKILKEKLNLID